MLSHWHVHMSFDPIMNISFNNIDKHRKENNISILNTFRIIINKNKKKKNNLTIMIG